MLLVLLRHASQVVGALLAPSVLHDLPGLVLPQPSIVGRLMSLRMCSQASASQLHGVWTEPSHTCGCEVLSGA